MILGITGGTGCGKTTLLNLIRDRGGLILDCDAIYNELLKTDTSMLSAIDARFPGTVENGVLDRKKLGAIVFADESALQDLNRITHWAVKLEVLRQMETAPALAAIDAIGLFEGDLAQLCDVTVAVTAPVEERVRRLMIRDGITEEYAASRIAAQKSNGTFVDMCDYTLANNTTLEQIRAKCLAFFMDLAIIKENL